MDRSHSNFIHEWNVGCAIADELTRRLCFYDQNGGFGRFDRLKWGRAGVVGVLNLEVHWPLWRKSRML